MPLRFFPRILLFTVFCLIWVSCLEGPGGFIFPSNSTSDQPEGDDTSETIEAGGGDVETPAEEEVAESAPPESNSDNQSTDNATNTETSVSEEIITRFMPKPLATWQWQLQGTIDTSFDVAVYDIDLFDSDEATIQTLHAQGRKVICYLSAGSWENWRPDQFSFPQFVKGKALDNWPGEVWLDISQIDVLQPIMETRMDLAQAKGCDAIEPDNIDGYTQDSGFTLTAADQLAYNTMLATMAHERDLSIALKNDLGQVNDLVSLFDFAINEACFAYNECTLLLPFIKANKAVFVAEYSADPTTFCPLALSMKLSAMKKKNDLKAEVLATCW